ncbi:LOW QUALITY PROTEIN: uncharacterized protein LOC108097029 [Drosophila ficusphila]|uniref:LOW QUALITY PROTEIN: uncharacterized protein LOC108097029 n=1 Tax=Drosophila ficusphila TaxID=30025 RepID=UPI0007E61F39|nr:LOW QUALITY PROTEIN: uncharacterized protein LOC108097029 [Drosophila ficusphila]
MANPRSSSGNKSSKSSKGHHHRHTQQNAQQTPQQQQQVDASQQSQVTPSPVAATALESPTAVPLAAHPSADTLALAAAVAASVPGAPLAQPAADRRASTPPAVVTPTESIPADGPENLATSRTASAAAPAAEHRRGFFQRFFGWS